MEDPVYAQDFRLVTMWQTAYVKEVMGPWRNKVKILNKEMLWHCHQVQLCYHHKTDDDTQSDNSSEMLPELLLLQEITPSSFLIKSTH